MKSKKNFEKKAQVSLEYLLLVSAFFSSLLIIIPTINVIVNDFLVLNDSLLVNQISEKVSEQDELFLFLSDGSKKEFYFLPSKEIFLKTINNELIIYNTKKSISIKLSSSQKTIEKSFNSKFKIIVEKKFGKTIISFE